MKIFLRLVFIFITIALAQYQSTTDSTITKKNPDSIKDINDIVNIIKNDSIVINTASEIFEYQMIESKLILSEAIISDATGDTLDAKYQFEILFEALSGIKIQKNISTRTCSKMSIKREL